jgi:isopentenyl diphosphate isomerase/L-lactate dehydrogenase-like FMN-dependent dehydrogenase
LDTAPATISVLPEIVDAVDGKVEVYVDGGVRRGTDVLKAIACGARAAFIGRPVLWGLVSGAETGVRHVLEMVRQEFDLASAHTPHKSGQLPAVILAITEREGMN